MANPVGTVRLPALSESAFQQQVVELLGMLGYSHNHVRRSIGRGTKWTTATSCVGYPDLHIWGRGRSMFRELKSDTGKLTTEQEMVLASMREAGIDADVWRPADLDNGRIQRELTRRTEP